MAAARAPRTGARPSSTTAAALACPTPGWPRLAERRMCEWCLFTLVLSATSLALELEVRGLIAFADTLIVRAAATIPQPKATPRAAEAPRSRARCFPRRQVWLSCLLPLMITLSARPSHRWLARSPYLCALSCMAVFADYVVGAEATDWDEYSNEDLLERAVETSRSRHVMLVCSMVTQLCVLLGLLFIARSAVSLLTRLQIDRKLRSSDAKRIERARARPGAVLVVGTATSDARSRLLLVDAANSSERGGRGGADGGGRDAALGEQAAGPR